MDDDRGADEGVHHVPVVHPPPEDEDKEEWDEIFRKHPYPTGFQQEPDTTAARDELDPALLDPALFQGEQGE